MKLLLLAISLFATILTVNHFLLVAPQQQQAQATGGIGEIKDIVDPIIDRTIQALQNNNTQLALEELDTLKNELKDTYEAEEEEEEGND